MPKGSKPKTENPVRKIEMSDVIYSEQIRSALPEIASPIRPGELVATWIERAARASGVPAARLRQYWHRKVEAVRVAEWLAVMNAAQEAWRRQQAITDLERDIQRRSQELARDHDRLVELHPVLARLAPPPPRSQAPAADEAPVVKPPAESKGRRAKTASAGGVRRA